MKIKSAITKMALGMPLLAASPAVVYAQDQDTGPFDISNFSSTVTITTDYVFRGISFSEEDPAIQGSMDWGYKNFYAGVWGSSIGIGGDDFSVELDFYGGYANSIGPINYDVMLIYFHFPGSENPFGEPDQFETWLTLSHEFSDLPGSPNASVRWSWSPDYTLEDGNGNYVRAGLGFTLPHGFGLDGYWGYQDVEGDKATGSGGLFASPGFLDDGYSYSHWSIGLTKSVIGFDLDFRYHETDEDAETAAFYGPENIDDRFVFTVSRSF